MAYRRNSYNVRTNSISPEELVKKKKEESLGEVGLVIEEGLFDKDCGILRISNYTNQIFNLHEGLPIGTIRNETWQEEEVELREDGIFIVSDEERHEESKETSQDEKDFREDRKKALSGKGISHNDKAKIREVLNEFKNTFKRKIVYDENKQKLNSYNMK